MKREFTMEKGFAYVMVAAVFLCNPISGFVDLLPNCIGYWLLCYGLHRLADLDGHLYEAVRRFRILSVLAVVQLLAAVFAYGVIERRATNIYEMRSFLMLGASLMLVAQLFLLLPAFREFFRGLEYLAARYTAPSLTQPGKGRTALQRMSLGTRLFVIISALAAFLPELSGYSSLDGQGENGTPGFNIEWYSSVLFTPSQTVDRYGYVHVLRALAVAVALIAGIAWLIAFLQFVKRLRREGEWLKRLDTRYREEILPQVGMLTVRRLRLCFFVLLVAIPTTFRIRIEERLLLPGLLFALLVGVFCLLLGEKSAERRACRTPIILLFVASILQLAFNSYYLSRFVPETSRFREDAYFLFVGVRAFDVLEVLCILWLWFCLLQLVLLVLRCHTGVCYGDGAELLSQKATERLHKRLSFRFSIAFAFAAVSVLSSVAEAFLRLMLPWFWYVPLLFAVVGFFLFSSALHELEEETRIFYHSDGMNKSI